MAAVMTVMANQYPVLERTSLEQNCMLLLMGETTYLFLFLYKVFVCIEKKQHNQSITAL